MPSGGNGRGGPSIPLSLERQRRGPAAGRAEVGALQGAAREEAGSAGRRRGTGTRCRPSACLHSGVAGAEGVCNRGRPGRVPHGGSQPGWGQGHEHLSVRSGTLVSLGGRWIESRRMNLLRAQEEASRTRDGKASRSFCGALAGPRLPHLQLGPPATGQAILGLRTRLTPVCPLEGPLTRGCPHQPCRGMRGLISKAGRVGQPGPA